MERVWWKICSRNLTRFDLRVIVKRGGFDANYSNAAAAIGGR